MKLRALPAFTDNYIWMLHDGRQAIVVDPGDAAPVAAALDAQGLALAAILVTHHHPDHVGGVAALRPRLQGPVYGPAREAIPQPFTPLADGDSVDVLGLRFQVIDVPGHTAGHIAYFLPAGDGQAPLLFCGDTLFSGGCGRLFEGTPAQMHAVARPPGRPAGRHPGVLRPRVHRVEPPIRGGSRTGQWRHRPLHRMVRGATGTGPPTLPSSIARELSINPFLRCAQPQVVSSAQDHGAELTTARWRCLRLCASGRTTSDDRSMWARVRNGFSMPDLEGDLVRKWERYYAERPDYVQRMTERGGRYLFHIVEEVKARPAHRAGPAALHRKRLQPAGHVGGARLGHVAVHAGHGRISTCAERVSRRPARRAGVHPRGARLPADAARHVRRLAAGAGRLQLGPGQRAARDHAQPARRPATDYDSLRMPDETRNYVPKLQAVKNIVADPQAFGLTLPPLRTTRTSWRCRSSATSTSTWPRSWRGLPVDEFRRSTRR
jgi:hydroxyacylglutathione hydrolase